MSVRGPVTVVVPCRDRADLLDRCLDRLKAAVRPDDEIVVVDSASRSADVGSVAQRHGVRLLRCDIAGASLARNAGWRAARSPYVVFVDDDALVTDSWRDALVQPLGEGVGFVTGRSVQGPATPGITEPPATIRVGQRGVYGASNNLAIPRQVLEHVGGFDERIGPGRWLSAGEDLELFDRILAAGYVGRYASSAVVDHVEWRGRRARVLLQWSYGKGMGARFAALAHHEPALAWRLRGDLFRVGGVLTALRRLRADDGAPAAAPVQSSRWLAPLLWRAGAVVGFVGGLVILRGDGAAAPAAGARPR